jgi:tRNA pseudouridine55 synthase
MNGVLVVDKPPGPTSHDVVAAVRRAVGISRIGHTGTLDPLATGVLPLVVGRATRLAQFLSTDGKAYLAGIRLGVGTATYDAEERLVPSETGEPVLLPVPQKVVCTEADLRGALADFTGTYRQVPPPFSAKKVGGRPAYALARTHKDVELKAVEVTVSELELVRYSDGLALVRGQRLRPAPGVRCASRVAAPDPCRRVRRAAGRAVVADSGGGTRGARPAGADRESVVEASARGRQRAGRPARRSRPAEDLRNADRAVPGPVGSGPVRVLDADGALLAIGQPEGGGLLQPVVVLV